MEHLTPTGSVAVFAPTTQLSVTVERASGADEVHVHAAGQGFWVARMLTVLGADPVLCTPIGGETGTALRALLGGLPSEGFVSSPHPNGSYIHDRRGGERHEVAHIASAPLDRHTIDELVSVTFAGALRAGHVVLTGTNLDGNVDPSTFERLSRDLRGAGVTVTADLSGDELRAALSGGLDIVKVSHEELTADGWAASDRLDDLWDGIELLHGAGAAEVVVSRSGDGVIASIGGRRYRATGPTLTVVEHRGAGDSMTAALAYGRLEQASVEDRLGLATAAAALNVTRHGLASGHRGAIDELARLVEVSTVSG